MADYTAFDRPETLIVRLRSLKPGEEMVYHQGFLAIDRVTSPGSVGKIARVAQDLYEAGKIGLRQQRISPNRSLFRYTARGL